MVKPMSSNSPIESPATVINLPAMAIRLNNLLM